MRCVLRWKELLLFVCLVLLPSGPVSAQSVLVKPYVQPGDARGASRDTKVLHWFTEVNPGEFVVEYQLPDGAWQKAESTRLRLEFAALKVEKVEKPKKGVPKPGAEKPDADDKKEPKVPLPPERVQHYFKYTARLDDLPLGTEVRYRVREDGRMIREDAFRTRARPDQAVRCVLVGDLAQGRSHQYPIAYQISLQKPEFLVALGDIVYPSGRMNQYMHFYWKTYNDVAVADPKTGAPLMAQVPFYPVIGNHDISAKLAKVPDALAIYYVFAPPKNGPGAGPWATPLDGDDAANAKFRAATTDSYPFVDAYSFDQGPAHFVVLNVNPKMDTSAPALRKWLVEDLRAAGDRWKIACYHMPAFHSSKKHYAEQQARPLSPLFEQEGVTLTFAGHVHNYQRTVPLKFRPDAEQKTKGRFNGTFMLDKEFDGVKKTRPSGIIHIVAGGGGASLYAPGLDKTKDALAKQYGANYADYTAKMVVDQHSFTVLDCAPDRLVLRAINGKGEELDRAVITKK